MSARRVGNTRTLTRGRVGLSYAQRVLLAAPMAYYEFGDTAGGIADTSPNGRNLAAAGTSTAPTYQQPPVSAAIGGYSMLFNGGTAFGAPSPSWLQGLSAVSVECWVKFTSTGPMVLAAVDNVALGLDPSRSFSLFTGSGTVIWRVYIGGASGSNPQLTSPVIDDGNWHHIVGTFATNDLRLYVDGALFASSTPGANTLNSGVNGWYSVGAGSSNGAANTQQLNGSLDELSIYNRVLSAAEVTSHYQGR